MTQNADTVEALLIVEVDERDSVKNIYVMPFSPMVEGIEYTLVGVDRENAEARFAQITCVSFVKVTRITLSSGALKPIEELEVGEKIITRDKGVQEIRWIGQSTMRATGDFAPVVIKAGALNNMHDLVVSPEHRPFVYQRTQSALPDEAKRGISLHKSSYRDVLEVDEDKLRSINAVNLLRQASRG